MIPELRKQFNEKFSEAAYRQYLEDLEAPYPGALDFRVAETPLFIPAIFRDQMLEACEHIIDVITAPEFKQQSESAIPANYRVPNEDAHPQCLVFDFGICEQTPGVYEPRLIEMQGFPSLFGYQLWHEQVTRRHFTIPLGFTSYLQGYDAKSYREFLQEMIVGKHAPESVILLEIFPHRQKTRIDFYCTEEYTGISIVCITELEKEGQQLFYRKNGKKIRVTRIYNRIIFDELQQQPPEVQEKGKLLFEALDVEWVPHPNWFYRISKHTMPFIHHRYVPETKFLSQLTRWPDDLENYVLKPLFSFAGQGVIIDLTRADLENIQDPSNWILQRKVNYADAIQTPDGPAKAEIRLFFFWKEGAPRPVAVNNLARLSKGKMIGVRYNKDKSWVGGTLAYFEPQERAE
jgi:hypothetical protein